MSKLEEFCYLVVQRDKANKKRKRLLYDLNKAYKKNHSCSHYHIRDFLANDKRAAYRNHADEMKSIAKKVYSPLRQELNIVCNYDGNNTVTSFVYKGETYCWNQIENLANTYLFESIVLTDNSINDAYLKLTD